MSLPRNLPAILFTCVCLACPPNSPQDTAMEPDTTGDPGTTHASTSTPTSGADATTAIPAACGDGLVAADETCDDGNGVNGDGCNNDCTPSAALVWEHLSGLAGYDAFSDVTVTKGGAIVAVGTRTTRTGGGDRWLVRLDLDGAVVWERTYDTSPTVERLLAAANHGTALYAAGTRETDDKLDLWFGRLDLDGALVWEKEVSSGFGNDWASGLAITDDGDVLVTGVVKEGLKAVDLWTRRYSPDGDVKWTQSALAIDLAYPFFGPEVVVTPQRIVIGHYFQGAGEAAKEALLAYAPASGEPAWTKLLTTYSMLHGLALAPGGDLIATGQALNPNRFVVRRFAVDGAPVWSTEQCTGDAGLGIAVDSQGDIVALGVGAGPVDQNVRLCKFTADGTLRWGKDIGTALGDDWGHAVRILPDDRILVAGDLADGESSDAWLALFTP